MTLTKWFPTDVKPVHIGVYEAIYHVFEDEWSTGYSFWNGKEWANSSDSIKGAYSNRKWIQGAIQEKKWRGLAEQPK